MIRIERSDCPACLADTPNEGDVYRKKEVVDALWKMQHRKCCYSEMEIPKEGHGKAVEHWQPKSVFTWRRNDWTNLLLVCPQCNGRKSDRFPVMLTENENETKVVYLRTPSEGTPAILDPSDPSDDPEEHLTYVLDYRDPLYGQVVPRDESVVGRETITVTGIDGEFFLRARRNRALKILERSYLQLLDAKGNDDAEALAVELRGFEHYMSKKQEFAGLAREFARDKRLDEVFGINIPGRDVS